MHTNDPKDPLEGKGEEMIPDRGIPFDDIEDSAPPTDEWEPPDSHEACEPDPESPAPPEGLESAPPASPFGDAELAALATPEGDAATPFEMSTQEIDTLTGEAAESFITDDVSPWNLSNEETTAIIGDTEEAFAPSPEMEASLMRETIPASTDKENAPMEENTRPPEDTPDEGMGTALEEARAAGETPPEMQDGGMSAGYPPVKDDALPPEPSTPVIEPEPESIQGALLFYGEGMEIPGPSVPKPDDGAPVPPEEVIATDTMLKLLVTRQRVGELWKRADRAGEIIENEIGNVQLARQLLDQIKFARHELLGGKDHYEEAERHINEAEFRVNFAQRVRKWSQKYGIPLFIYEIVFGAVLIGSLFFTPLGKVAFASGTDIARNAAAIIDPTLVYLLACMIWGGFGGVIGALLSLVRHISEDQDFDKQFMIWYVGSPWMGMGVGIAVYLFMRTGLLSILGSDPDSNITSPIVIYVLAWLAGYQHNIFTEIVRRMMKVFRIESEEKEKEAAPPAPKSGQQAENTGQTTAPQKPPDEDK